MTAALYTCVCVLYVRIRTAICRELACTVGDIDVETPLTVLTFQGRARAGF